MILALLLAAAAPATAEEAEREFAATAQVEGQWTAFRGYAAANGWMFVPEAVNAQDWLRDRKNPLVSVMWWPAQSWVSCDGSVAVNTGPWVRQGGRSVGYFTTVWTKQEDGSWKWLVDHGDVLAKPRPAGERASIRRAKCLPDKPAGKGFVATVMEDSDGQAIAGGGPARSENGRSIDGSLRWSWKVLPDKSRRVTAEIWTGSGYETVLEDKVAAAP